MSGEVAVINQKELSWTPEQEQLILDTICRGATKDEAKLFLYRAKTMRLDPLKPGQIHFVKYGNSPGTIVIGIEGFRTIAGRSGRHTGTQRGIIRDEKGKALAGWAEVSRSDWEKPARLEVSMAEYNKGSGPWKTMPESMIQKVAEAGALRMAFPDDLGGVYSQEEMDQARHAQSRIAGSGVPWSQDQPGDDDGVENVDEKPTFTRGKFAKRYPREVDAVALRRWVTQVGERLANPNKPLEPEERKEWEYNVTLASSYLAEVENVKG